MGYLYLLAGVCFNAAKGYCGKKQSLYLNGARHALTVNFLRMLCCAAVGAVLLSVRGGFVLPALSSPALPILIVAGIFNASQVVFWLPSVQRSAVTLTDVFATLGLIIPMIVCRILFGEPYGLTIRSEPGVRTTVRILMPARRKEELEAYVQSNHRG